MLNINKPVFCEWNLRVNNRYTGELLYSELGENIVVYPGRQTVIQSCFNLAPSAIIAMAIGACATVAAATDTRLNYEHILDNFRYTLTDTNGNPLVPADVITSLFTDGLGNTYYKAITMQAQVNGATTGNANQPVQEYGLVSATNWGSGSITYGGSFTGLVSKCPSSPFGTAAQGSAQSTLLFNHYIGDSPIILTSDIVLTIDVTIRV